MPVVGVLFLKGELKKEQLEKLIFERMVAKIFRARAVIEERENWTYFREVDADSLDRDYHFRTIDKEFECNTEWSKVLNELANEKFDSKHPSWVFHLVKRLPCGRPAIVFVSDHAVGDGVSWVSLFREEICDGFDKSKPMGSSSKKSKPPQLGEFRKAWNFVKGAVVPFIELGLPADEANRLKIDISEQKISGYNFASTPKPLSLEKLKTIKSKVPGATMNDAMLAVATRGIRRLYNKIEEPLMKGSGQLRATYVANMRPMSAEVVSDKWFGNDFVVASVLYPLHLADPVDTVIACRNNTRLSKTSFDFPARAVVRDMVLPLTPRSMLTGLAKDLNCKYSATMSNVFISHDPLFLGGVEIDDLQFSTFVPFGLYLGISTYNGKVNYNVTLANEVGLDAKELANLFENELEEVFKATKAISSEDLASSDKWLTTVAPQKFTAADFAVSVTFLGLFYGASAVASAVVHDIFGWIILAASGLFLYKGMTNTFLF